MSSQRRLLLLSSRRLLSLFLLVRLFIFYIQVTNAATTRASIISITTPQCDDSYHYFNYLGCDYDGRNFPHGYWLYLSIAFVSPFKNIVIISFIIITHLTSRSDCKLIITLLRIPRQTATIILIAIAPVAIYINTADLLPRRILIFRLMRLSSPC